MILWQVKYSSKFLFDSATYRLQFLILVALLSGINLACLVIHITQKQDGGEVVGLVFCLVVFRARSLFLVRRNVVL